MRKEFIVIIIIIKNDSHLKKEERIWNEKEICNGSEMHIWCKNICFEAVRSFDTSLRAREWRKKEFFTRSIETIKRPLSPWRENDHFVNTFPSSAVKKSKVSEPILIIKLLSVTAAWRDRISMDFPFTWSWIAFISTLKWRKNLMK